MLSQHDTQIRVRYQETDGQGRLHHANYFIYFEQARVEFLRAVGKSYRAVEESGLMLVVVEIGCEYFLPASFDDLLTVRCRVVRAKGARMEHAYEVFRDGELLARGRSIVACIDRSGKPKRIPDWLLPDASESEGK
ncbi:MAG TPA: thioesterase family protein [Pirellulales bacterium]|jgi:acyl-CoA thioester hydrolase|nr:thioesterase family protein [Pirellulales bacterium]